MSPRPEHRERFLAVRSLLQAHDPYGLIAKYGGDRFDDQIYGYEATTILDRLGNEASSAAVAEILAGLAARHGRSASAEASRKSAQEIAASLGAI